MGVDIYGRSPQLKGEQPQIEFATASEGAKTEYFEALEAWEEENPGYYFRSNWWGWRPIVFLVDAACQMNGLKVDTSSWHYNDGTGPETQTECDQIADALENVINKESSPLKEDTDRIYVCMGSWCTSEGYSVENDIEEELNNQYVPGEVLTSSVIASNGQMVQSSHSSSLGHVKNFIKFLRNCGGFQVY